MNFKRTLIILSLAVFILISISCAYASENATEIESQSGETSLAIDEKDNGTFKALDIKINNASEGSTVKLQNDYVYEGPTYYNDGIIISKPNIIIDGQGHKIDGNKQARIFKVKAVNVTLKNITFVNGNTVNYGAVYWVDAGGSLKDCVFVNNSAKNNGGALYWGGVNGTLSDCVFVNNHVDNDGGAVYWQNSHNGYISCCSFENNHAYRGGAIIASQWNCVFVDSCIFKTVSDTTHNIIIHPPILTVNNFTLTYGSGEKLTFNLTTNRGKPITNGNITIEIYNNNTLFGNFTCLSGEGLPVNLPVGTYYAVYKTADYGLTPVNGTISVKMGTKITSESVVARYNENKELTVTLKDDLGNPIGGVEVSVDLDGIKTIKTDENGQINVSTRGLVPNIYAAKITFNGSDNYSKSSNEVQVIIKKATSKITAAEVTTTYNTNKDMVITLTDNNNKLLAGVLLTVDLNGVKNYTTDANGQIKVLVTGLAPNTYTAKVSFAGNENYTGADGTANVIVKKATAKITAKTKTFKAGLKTKKYTIILKDSANKGISKVKVSIKVKSKIYAAKTSSSGKATFKIKKLTKKGKFKATITFKGNNCYNNAVKKVKIYCK